MLDSLLTFSDALVSRVAGAGAGLACIHPGAGAHRTATLWRPRVLVTSAQGLPPDAAVPAVLPGDILLAVDGAAAPGLPAMARALRGCVPGTDVTLRLLLGGMPIELPVHAAARVAA